MIFSGSHLHWSRPVALEEYYAWIGLSNVGPSLIELLREVPIEKQREFMGRNEWNFEASFPVLWFDILGTDLIRLMIERAILRNRSPCGELIMKQYERWIERNPVPHNEIPVSFYGLML